MIYTTLTPHTDRGMMVYAGGDNGWQSVRRLVSAVSSLTLLDLQGCYKVSDPAVIEVANKLPSLTLLNLGGLGEITDTAVQVYTQGPSYHPVTICITIRIDIALFLITI